MSRHTVPFWLCLPVAACLCPLIGCGGAPQEKAMAPAGDATEEKPKAAKNEAPVDPAAVNATAQAPMIIYTATIDVVVNDLAAATSEVDRLVAEQKGFVAKSEVKEDTGRRRIATYTVRVPVAGFGGVKGGILALGTPERNVVDTQDVTEEFVDVEARIKNLKDQEDKLNELLKEKRKEEKLEDVIKVSDRVFQVRGDIERAQGRRNYLKNRVQLSTLNITLREVKDYTPPTAPAFGSRVRKTLENSWDALVSFCAGIAIIAVALVPWAPLWVPALIAAWVLWRRARKAWAASLAREAEERAKRARPRRSRVTADEAGEEVEERVEPVDPPVGPKPGGA